MVPMPSAEGFRASVRVWLDDIRVVAAECGFAAIVKGGCLIVCVWDHLIERKRSW